MLDQFFKDQEKTAKDDLLNPLQKENKLRLIVNILQRGENNKSFSHGTVRCVPFLYFGNRWNSQQMLFLLLWQKLKW